MKNLKCITLYYHIHWVRPFLRMKMVFVWYITLKKCFQFILPAVKCFFTDTLQRKKYVQLILSICDNFHCREYPLNFYFTVSRRYPLKNFSLVENVSPSDIRTCVAVIGHEECDVTLQAALQHVPVTLADWFVTLPARGVLWTVTHLHLLPVTGNNYNKVSGFFTLIFHLMHVWMSTIFCF